MRENYITFVRILTLKTKTFVNAAAVSHGTLVSYILCYNVRIPSMFPYPEILIYLARTIVAQVPHLR